jgi:hypothetical protein
MQDNPLIRLSGYELRHLASHLVESGRANELNSLLQIETATGGNAWFDAKEAAGDRFLFASDVELAWTVAISQKPGGSDLPNIDERNPLASHQVSLSLRYALITASLNALDHDHYPGFIFLLVRYGIWNVERALASVTYEKNAWNQAALLRRLLPLVPDSLLPTVLSLARSIDFYHASAQVLAVVASRLPQPERDAVVEEAFQVATSRGPEYLHNDTLTDLAPLLPDKMLWDAIALAQNIKHVFSQALVLTDLLRQLPPADRRKHLKQILALVNAEPRRDLRVVALARLSDCMSPRDRVKTLKQAVALASSASTHQEQAAACAALLPHLPNMLKRPAVVALLRAVRQSFAQTAFPETGQGRRSQPESWILEALLGCPTGLGHVGVEEQSEAISFARRIENELEQARLLAEFALPAKESLQGDSFSEALRIMDAIPNDGYRAIVWRCYGASGRAKELSDDQLLVVLGGREFVDADRWLRDVTSILDSVPEDRKTRLLRKSLTNSRQIKDEEERAKVLFPLLPALNDNQLAEAQVMAEACPSIILRAQLLITISQVSKTKAAMIRQRVLAIANETEHFRAQVLVFLVPHLIAEELHQALESILTIKFLSDRAEALAHSAGYLPRALQVRAVEALCFLVTEEHEDPKWLAALAPHLSAPLRSLALATVIDAVIKAPWKALSLVELSPALSEDSIAQVFEIALRVEDREERDEIIWALILRSLELGEVDRALTWVDQISHSQTRFVVLKSICSRLVSLDRTPRALDILENCEDDERLRLLDAIVEAAEEPIAKETAERAVRIARNIDDEETRAEALATLLPVLPLSLQRQILKQTLTLLFSTHQVVLILGLLEQLKQNQSALTIRISAEMLGHAFGVSFENGRASLVGCIASHLKPKALHLAVGNIRMMADPHARLVGLAGLYPFVDAELAEDFRQALSELLQQSDPKRPEPHRIIDLIPTLVPCISQDLREALLNFACDSTRAYASGDVRDRTLAYLAKTLCNNGLPAKGLEIASSITDTNLRAEALDAVSLHLAESIAPITKQEWHLNLRELARRNRNEFCSDLSILCPAIKTLGGENCLSDTFEALRCVARWWP